MIRAGHMCIFVYVCVCVGGCEEREREREREKIREKIREKREERRRDKKEHNKNNIVIRKQNTIISFATLPLQSLRKCNDLHPRTKDQAFSRRLETL